MANIIKTSGTAAIMEQILTTLIIGKNIFFLSLVSFLLFSSIRFNSLSSNIEERTFDITVKQNIKYDKSSSSMSLISRKVLTADEVLKFESPYAIEMLLVKLLLYKST